MLLRGTGCVHQRVLKSSAQGAECLLALVSFEKHLTCSAQSWRPMEKRPRSAANLSQNCQKNSVYHPRQWYAISSRAHSLIKRLMEAIVNMNVAALQAVPSQLTRYGLSQVINHLLALGAPSSEAPIGAQYKVAAAEPDGVLMCVQSPRGPLTSSSRASLYGRSSSKYSLRTRSLL